MGTTAIYAGLLVPLFLYLSVNVISKRREARQSLGDGGNDSLQRAIRMHGNFAEYAPYAVILLAIAESQGAAATMLHLIGATLLIGRVIHALGLRTQKANFRLRVGGMALTFASIGIAGAANLWLAFV
jgi:uncharacterized membrane protein YecN with MAPEG domain